MLLSKVFPAWPMQLHTFKRVSSPQRVPCELCPDQGPFPALSAADGGATSPPESQLSDTTRHRGLQPSSINSIAPRFCGHHNSTIPGSPLLCHSSLSKRLSLYQTPTKTILQKLEQTFLRPPHKPYHSPTADSWLRAEPLGIDRRQTPSHATNQELPGRSRGDQQGESKAKMPSRLQANNLL